MIDSTMKNPVDERAGTLQVFAGSYLFVVVPALTLWMTLGDYRTAAFFAVMSMTLALPVSLLAFSYSEARHKRLCGQAFGAASISAAFNAAVYLSLFS